MSLKIMVTGAGGQYGSLAIDYIKKFNPNVKLYGLIHSPQKAEALKAKGVEPCLGDFNDKESLVKVFQGIDRLLFVSVPTPGVQKNVVDAAKECKIKFIAYTSIAQVDKTKFGLEVNHSQTEKWIKESGIPHTILRNSWYVDLNEGLLKATQKTGRFLYTTDEGVISHALRREYAEAGAKVILGENYPEILNLARKATSYPELAKVVEKALGKKIEVKKVTPEEFEKYLTDAQVSQVGKMLSINMQKYVKDGNNGEELNTEEDFEKALGRPLEPYADIIKEYLSN